MTRRSDLSLRERTTLRRVERALREMRGGRDNDSRFVTRMTGEGVWAELLHRRFEVRLAGEW